MSRVYSFPLAQSGETFCRSHPASNDAVAAVPTHEGSNTSRNSVLS
jgi:hypothetical protein